MSVGYFKVNRKLFDNELWLKEPFTRGQAWIDLIGLANHKEGYILVRGIKVELKRGDVGWSVLNLAKRWKWSRGKVNRFLKLLKTEEQIVIKQDNKTDIKLSTVISLKNYDKYQSNEQENRQQTDNKRTTNDTLTINDKNVKNDKEKIYISKKNFKKEKTYKIKTDNGEKEFTLQEIAERLLNHFNKERKTNFTNTKSFLANLETWLEVYSPEQIAESISQIKYSWWKDKDITPLVLFRTTNKGEPCDRIGDILNSKKENYVRR